MFLLAQDNGKCAVGLVLGLLGVCVLGMPAAAQSSTPDPGVPEANGDIRCIVQSGNRVYVAGNFTVIGGVSRNRLAAFDATTGVVDANWDPNLNADPLALVVSGGKVHAGGYFTTVNGGTIRNYLAAFNVADGSDTGTALAWDPNANTSAYALAPSGSGVFAGGDFTAIGGNAKAYLAGFDSTVPVELSIFTAD